MVAPFQPLIDPVPVKTTTSGVGKTMYLLLGLAFSVKHQDYVLLLADSPGRVHAYNTVRFETASVDSYTMAMEEKYVYKKHVVG